jgi:type IV pilus assembly protein PilB
MITFDDESQNQRVSMLHKQEEERLVEMLSKKYNIPYLQLTPEMIEIEAIPILNEQTSRDAFIVVYAKPTKRDISVAIFSPNNQKTLDVIELLKKKGFVPNISMASRESLSLVWNRYKEISQAKSSDVGVLNVENDDISVLMAGISNTQQIREKIETLVKSKKTHQMSNLFEFVLAGAFSVKSSDIHIEPQDEDVRIRYRIDGVLQDIALISHDLYKRINTRIKLLSGLKLNVQKDTQDGRFSIRFKDMDVEIRTSILPGQYGESVVLRILDPDSISVSLEGLGINDHLLGIIKNEISKPTGMILTTGPTGSGKTTTLYAFLKKVLQPDIKIITIEDPIEYHLKGVVQTQVSTATNYTFLSGLRAALRQDPDIIMVGEIRDGETAKIAINASLTGHLVLSTIHTNSAAGTIPRLIDFEINPKVLSAALSLIIAQRLVRKLCPYCKKETIPTEKERSIIEKTVEEIKIKIPGVTITMPEKMLGANPEGCEKCNGLGYKGRVGIYEAVIMDNTIEAILDKNPSEQDIVKAAIPQGILSMKEDGIIKVLEGVTTIDELSGVIDLE